MNNLIEKDGDKLKIKIPLKLPYNNQKGLYKILYADIVNKKKLLEIINKNTYYKYLLNFNSIIILFQFNGEKVERLIPLEYLYDNLRLYIFDLVYYQRYKDLIISQRKELDNLQKLSKEVAMTIFCED